MNVVMATTALPEDTVVRSASLFGLLVTAGGTWFHTGKPALPAGWRL